MLPFDFSHVLELDDKLTAFKLARNVFKEINLTIIVEDKIADLRAAVCANLRIRKIKLWVEHTGQKRCNGILIFTIGVIGFPRR